MGKLNNMKQGRGKVPLAHSSWTPQPLQDADLSDKGDLSAGLGILEAQSLQLNWAAGFESGLGV